MPSWNIHMALADAIYDARPDCILDGAAFLFGNLLPDLYVGYMVSDVSKHITYEETHFADPDAVPIPQFEEFWEDYGAQGAKAGSYDLCLGTYTHLIADAVFNSATQKFLADNGIPRGEAARIKKQADFDTFGKSLALQHAPKLTEKVLIEAFYYPQYTIDDKDLKKAEKVALNIYENNNKEALNFNDSSAMYCMLTRDFFESCMKRAIEVSLVNVERIAKATI